MTYSCAHSQQNRSSFPASLLQLTVLSELLVQSSYQPTALMATSRSLINKLLPLYVGCSWCNNITNKSYIFPLTGQQMNQFVNANCTRLMLIIFRFVNISISSSSPAVCLSDEEMHSNHPAPLIGIAQRRVLGYFLFSLSLHPPLDLRTRM